MLLDEELKSQIGMWLEVMLSFNSVDHELIWKYIIVVASQLEYRCIVMLLISDGENPNKFWEYEERTTLNQAVDKLKKKHILSEELRQAIKTIGKLRNSVLHRKVLTGITEYAVYKERRLFYDAEAVKELLQDVTSIMSAMDEWISQHSGARPLEPSAPPAS